MSDHFSGPRALADPVLDISEMYVFPSPERPGVLVLAMNVFPFAGKTAFFSDVVEYRFRVRPATIASKGPGAAFAVSEKEYIFSCRFAAPVGRDGGGQLVQEGACTASTGQAVSFRVDDEGGGQAQGLRVFAGHRMDSFFLDAARVAQSLATGKLAFVEVGFNAPGHQNVMSVVVEIERAKIFAPGDGPLFAVICETMLPAGPLTVRFERYGRPEIKNFVLFTKNLDPVNRDLEIRDLYNQEDAFKLKPTYLGAFRSRMNANLAYWDSLDGKTDWPLDAHGSHPLTGLLLADFQVVDVSKPEAENSYLEIERMMLKGVAHESCGGRWINDDAMDTWITLLVNGGNGPRIRDGVDQPSVPATRVFPYLVPAEPNPPPPVDLSVLDSAKGGA